MVFLTKFFVLANKGRTHHMMKVSSKRRRSKKEIEEAKKEASNTSELLKTLKEQNGLL